MAQREPASDVVTTCGSCQARITTLPCPHCGPAARAARIERERAELAAQEKALKQGRKPLDGS